MTPPAAPTQRLTLVEQATSRWIAGASRRHPLTLVIAAGVVLLGDVSGANVDSRAYMAMAAWIAIAFIEGPWCTRPAEFLERRRRYAATLVVDALMLGAALFFLNAVQFVGVAGFVLIVVSAAVVLPQRAAWMITGLVLAVFVSLVVMAVYGPESIASPFGLAPVTGNETFLVTSAAVGAVVIFLVLRMQAHVLRTVRDSDTRHQAVIRAANDAIILFDFDGKIVEVNPAMLHNTGYSWEELKAMANSGLFLPEGWPTALGARHDGTPTPTGEAA